MPTPTNKQAAQDLIHRVADLLREGATKQAQYEARRATAAIQTCRPQDREALNEALAEALVTHGPSAGVTLRPYSEVAGVPALVDKGVDMYRQAVNDDVRPADAAWSIAELQIDARLLMLNKHGLADVIADSKHTKDITRDMVARSREGVDAAKHKSLARSVRNRLTDVVVSRLRALDDNPGSFPAATMERARGAFPALSPTEAVYALYDSVGVSLPRVGRTELARDDARRRADLVRQATAGEVEDSDEDADVHDVASDLEAVERLEASLIRYAQRAEGLPDADRARVKARLNAVIASLAVEAAKL